MLASLAKGGAVFLAVRQHGYRNNYAIHVAMNQIEQPDDLPYAVTSKPEPLLTTAEQGNAWEDALGGYCTTSGLSLDC